MQRAVDHVGTLVQKHEIDCDYQLTGLLTVANAPAQARRVQHEVHLAQELGLDGIEWLDQTATRAQIDSPLYLGARYERQCALINPAKLVRGLQRIAEDAGVEVYERTPVGAFTPGKHGSMHRLETPYGTVRAERVVFATNAFSTAFPQLAGKAFPVYTYIVLTEPLSDAQLARIGWQGRQGIEDGRNLVHYYRLTADNRLLMGGDVLLTYAGGLTSDHHARTFNNLEAFIGQVFPSLRSVHITHRWGGPVSVPLDMAPALGYLGHDRRIVYSLGCVGHGVAHTTYVGHLLADLVLDRTNPDRDLFFVNRRTIPLPPEPLRFGVGSAIRAGLRVQDQYDERKMHLGSR
jgi:glycine/D-amino acid oxidase-like deaminating enzyme